MKHTESALWGAAAKPPRFYDINVKSFNIDFNFTSLEILVKNFSWFRLKFQKCESSVFQLSEEFTKFTCVSCPRCLELDFLNCANEGAGVWNFKPFEIQSGILYKLFDPVFGVAQLTQWF